MPKWRCRLNLVLGLLLATAAMDTLDTLAGCGGDCTAMASKTLTFGCLQYGSANPFYNKQTNKSLPDNCTTCMAR